jgi:hypothetical protein
MEMRRSLVWVMLLGLGCKAKADAAASAPAAEASAAQVASAFALAAQALSDAQANGAGKAASAAPSAASAVATASAAPSASATADAGFSPSVANELGRLGFSTAAADLTALGKDRGVLLSALSRLTGHPAALSAVFGSDKVVNAFMKRTDMQDACREPEKLKPLLLYVLSSAPARAWVNDKDSIKAFSDSKLGAKLLACPAFKALAAEPKALAQLTSGQAEATAVVNHPNFRAELERLKIRQDATGSKFARKLFR